MKSQLLRRCLPVVVTAALALFAVTPSASAAVQFETKKAVLPQGAYQIDYSARNDSLWVTTACCRPPLEKSELLEIDPDTLEVKRSWVQGASPSGDGLEGVYGIAVNDATNTVWVSLTRENAVGVYSMETGEKVAHIPDIEHGREVEVDAERGVVYVSAVYGGQVVKIDANSHQILDRIETNGQPMGLDFDPAANKLFTTTLDTGQLVVIDGATGAAQHYPIPTQQASNIAYDPQRQRVYIAAQGTANLVVADANTGQVIENIPTANGSLTVDVLGDLIFVGNFFSASISVINAETLQTEETIANDGNPNHMVVHDGSVYVVDKSAAAPDNGDYITRYTPVGTGPTDPGPTDPGPTDPTPGSQQGISIDVNVGQNNGADGKLTMTVASDTVDLGTGSLAGDRINYSGAIPAVTVTDQRTEATAAGGGWSVSGQAGDFTSGENSFGGNLLGWTPTTPQAKDGLTLGSAVASALGGGGQGLSAASTLATAKGAARSGSTTLGADLALAVPVDTPVGSYASTLTVSLFPTD